MLLIFGRKNTAGKQPPKKLLFAVFVNKKRYNLHRISPTAVFTKGTVDGITKNTANLSVFSASPDIWF